jgi:hypothetical protein
MDSENNSSSVTIFIVVGLIILGAIFWGNDSSSSDYGGYDEDYPRQKTIDTYDAKSDYWDEIKEYIDGTYTVEACSEDSGNCYDLDLDTNDGYTDTLNFSDGGYIYISTEIDSNGRASDYDDDGDYWDITLSDSDIDDAVEEWASDNEYILE